MLTKANVQRFLIALYVAAVVLSAALSILKYQALGYHTRDYAFYLQFASKFLDGNSSQTYALNPDGKNWLFMEGVEGIRGFHKALHFEPIKYTYAVVFSVFQSAYALFLFIALLCFLPLLYIAFALPMKTPGELRTALTLGLVYATIPSALFLPGFDLRPYLFLAPFFFLALLAIHYARPAWEQILWFNALFLAREEAIIFGASLLLFAFFKKLSGAIRKPILAGLVFSYTAWTLLTIGFLKWSGYPILVEKLPFRVFNPFKRLDSTDSLIFLTALLGGLALVVGMWFVWKKFGRAKHFQSTAETVSLGVLLVPLGYQFITEYDPNWVNFVFFSPRYFLHFTTLLSLALVVIAGFRISIPNKAWIGMLSAYGIFILVLNISSPYNAVTMATRQARNAQSASPIWAFKQTLNPYKAHVLVDYATYQAFYNVENLYVYNRLPWALVEGEARHYPANHDILSRLINEQIDYIVVSATSRQDVDELLSGSGLSIQTVFENNSYLGLEIIRSR